MTTKVYYKGAVKWVEIYPSEGKALLDTRTKTLHSEANIKAANLHYIKEVDL